MLTAERQKSVAGGGTGRRSVRCASLDHGACSKRGSAIGGTPQGACRGNDITADLAELRAKHEQRRASEADEPSTILTATQIASMLEGDVVMSEEDVNRPRLTRRASMMPMPGAAPPSKWIIRYDNFMNALWKQWTPIRTFWDRFVQRGYMLEATSPLVVMCDCLLSVAALYNAVYIPLALAMPNARWSTDDADTNLGYTLDAVFLLDVKWSLLSCPPLRWRRCSRRECR